MNVFLKPECQTDSPVSADGAETVFVIFIIEKVFDCAENTQVQFFLPHFECVARRQIGAAVAVEAKDVS